MTQPSLAYRNNTDAIWRGEIPQKYTRLLPYITGQTVLEIGSAEGVLALLLASERKFVVGIEKNQERYAEATRLRNRWREIGREVDRCVFLNLDVRKFGSGAFYPWDNSKDPFQTVVAVRSIYYLREDAQAVLNEIGKNRVPQVVLCGNKNRAAWSEAERAKNALGKWNYLASVEGMTELITRAGYEIDVTVTEGDPIVVGRMG